jgi:hypothetical protein
MLNPNKKRFLHPHLLKVKLLKKAKKHLVTFKMSKIKTQNPKSMSKNFKNLMPNKCKISNQ